MGENGNLSPINRSVYFLKRSIYTRSFEYLNKVCVSATMNSELDGQICNKAPALEGENLATFFKGCKKVLKKR